MSRNRHVPVLLTEVVGAFEEALSTGEPAAILDATLGGAGHTRALLERYPRARILGCDRDPAAVEAARANLAELAAAGRFAAVAANFSDIVGSDVEIPGGFGPPWGGALLDLGYSSNQLEDPAYGMSFMTEGPLDMRLSREGQSAWDILCDSRAEELADILETYGEVPGAMKVARAIKAGLDESTITDSTLSLARFMERMGRGRDSIHPATLVFQALRIAVNDELRALDHFLNNVILCLKSRAPLVVITFHSVEDRLVKQWGKKRGDAIETVTRKPVSGDLDEVRSNPRARSAKLRIYRKR